MTICRAAEWLFSHSDDIGGGQEDDTPTADVVGLASGDLDESAEGKYSLIGIVSHLGRNIDCGHYVCHVKKDGRWAFFNDDKVAKSESPPFDCGFMYLFRRDDGSGVL